MTAPQDISHLFSEEAKLRNESRLKTAFKYFNDPNIVFLGGGLPLSDYFPWNKLTTESPAPPFANGIGADLDSLSETIVTTIFKRPEMNTEGEIPLARSLQYGMSEGQKELIDFVKEHTAKVHQVPYNEWDCIATAGNTQAWDALLRTFLNKGETVLVEEFSFPSALETAQALDVVTYPCPMDDFGLIPEKLGEILDSWVGKKPKMLYTIPTGQNPTGSSLNVERREAIYKLAQKHDFIIIEDEPYYFLQMESYTSDESARKQNAVKSYGAFLDALVTSFLELDVDGRVVRIDSFSKVLAPGVRLGWVTASNQIIERLLRIHEVTIQAPSGFTQSIVNGLLQRWGQNGYLDWLIQLRAEYTAKRDVAIDSIAKYFPKSVTHYNPPVAGMFFTFQIDASKHPKFATEFDSDPLKVEDALFNQGLQMGVLMIPGSWFLAKGQTNPPQPATNKDPATKNMIFFRGTYAAVQLDLLKVGLQRFGIGVSNEFGLGK